MLGVPPGLDNGPDWDLGMRGVQSLHDHDKGGGEPGGPCNVCMITARGWGEGVGEGARLPPG